MIGKIIGAFVGSKAAKQTSAIGGPTGAALGVVAPMILRRVSIPAMLAIAAGGYAMKKLNERSGDSEEKPTEPVAPSRPVTAL